MSRRLTLSVAPAERLFDTAEAGLIARGLATLGATSRHDAEALSSQVDRLRILGDALGHAPSLFEAATRAGARHDMDSLIERLAHLDPLDGELGLPEKAVAGRAFLLAKIALLREFRVAFLGGAPGADAALALEFRGELAQAIYTAIAVEILLAVLTDERVAETTRRWAARQLILIWERATHVEIDDFCPMLESAWRARSHIAPAFGVLLGTVEYMRLVAENCSDQFLGYFARDNVTPDEHSAFEEFLFGMPYEELEKLRAARRQEDRSVIDTAYASRVLQRSVDEAAVIDDPEALYRSYRRRLRAAEERRIRQSSQGPRRVAESYLMIYLLDQGAVPPQAH